MKMEGGGFQLGAHQELQPADYPTSSLASLCLTEEAAVISRSADHMAHNPEPRSGFPGMMSSPGAQSQQQKEAADVEPCPAVQGKVHRAVGADVGGNGPMKQETNKHREFSPGVEPAPLLKRADWRSPLRQENVSLCHRTSRPGRGEQFHVFTSFLNL